jgi:hypothetical protein
MDTPSHPSPIQLIQHHEHGYVLNQVMLQYLDIDGLIKSQDQMPEFYKNRLVLATLAHRFNLPRASTFKQFLQSYDTTYATVRSFNLGRRTKKQITLQAALEGDMKTFTDLLNMYKELHVEGFYRKALRFAARGHHLEIAWLLQDLIREGYVDVEDSLEDIDGSHELFIGAAEGGHIDILETLNLNELYEQSGIEGAVAFSQLDTIKYLVSQVDPVILEMHISNSMQTAGNVGNLEIIDYLLTMSQNYEELLMGAALGGHLNLIKKYWNKPGVTLDVVFSIALSNGHFEITDFILSKTTISDEVINELFVDLAQGKNPMPGLNYLANLGADNYSRMIMNSIGSAAAVDIIKTFIDGAGEIDFKDVFLRAIDQGDFKVLNYLQEIGYKPKLWVFIDAVEYIDTPAKAEYLVSLGFKIDELVKFGLKGHNLFVVKRYLSESSIPLPKILKYVINHETYDREDSLVLDFILSNYDVTKQMLDDQYKHEKSRTVKKMHSSPGAETI